MKFDLEERLINFAVQILEIVEALPGTKGSSHLSGQLLRCGTAPALHYGEAQSAESRKDFIHKMKIAVKEMRESLSCLTIIERKKYLTDQSIVNSMSELNQLISIFVKSIKTAKTKHEHRSAITIGTSKEVSKMLRTVAPLKFEWPSSQ